MAANSLYFPNLSDCATIYGRMLVAYFSPLAPAVVLLLGAFILPVALAFIAGRQQPGKSLHFLIASGVVELAILALFGVRLGGEQDLSLLEPLSRWSFAAPHGEALVFRADEQGLPFLILVLIILLAVTLAAPSFSDSPEINIKSSLTSWLGMGAGACLLLVAANDLTLIYAVLVFDGMSAFYWLRLYRPRLVAARLLLGLVTAGGLSLAGLGSTGSGTVSFLLGLALWLRLGLYPYIEISVYRRRWDYGFLVYLGLSLVVGIYLAARVLAESLPAWLSWLTVVLMFLFGLQAWLAGNRLPAAEGEEPAEGPRSLILVHVVFALALPFLIVAPLAPGIGPAYAAGLSLSLVALWLTPFLGLPDLSDRSSWWFYLPPLAAGLTLVSFPFTLGWAVRTVFYHTLLNSAGPVLPGIIMLAEALAFGGLVHYGLSMRQEADRDNRRSAVGLLASVPFLIPVVAPLLLGAVAHTPLPAATLAQPGPVLAATLLPVVGGGLLGYFYPRIIAWFRLSPLALAEWARLEWLGAWAAVQLNRLAKGVLRIQVMIEGQHYLGWALFVGLMSGLIILLS